MNTLSDEQLVELDGRTFYLLLENEYTKEGDVAPTSLACGPVLYAQSEGMFAVKDSDTLRPFDISPLLSTIQSLRTELAASKEREQGLSDALTRFSRIKESWPLWGIIESLCDATKHGFDHYDMRPDGWEAWSVNERLARELCTVMKVEIPLALSQPPQSPQTNCTCDAFKIAQCKGTDNEMYGSLISFWSGEYHTGCDVPTIQFCPWCGKKPQPPTKGEES
jgi:hypothetical protein